MMWDFAPREMKRYKIGAVGSFDPRNIHGGECWGWPRECKLTNSQAKSIYYTMYKTEELTIDQLIVVRKSFAYAWELRGGTPGGNFLGVKDVWSVVRESKTATKKHHVIPERIPTPAELKVPFNTEWSPDSPLSLVHFCQGQLAANDLFIFGLRSTEDVKRVKDSSVHHNDWANGWQATEFKGGRCKLCGTKKGTRPWRIWRVCRCPGKHHIRPPATFFAEIRKDGNPRCEVKWDPLCPVAAVEFIFSLQDSDTKGCYRKWLSSGRMSTSPKNNIADVRKVAVDWLMSQGATSEENRYDLHAGRKCLARLCSHLEIDYPQSFQIHADLPDTWAGAYEKGVIFKTETKIRTQSQDPWIATEALRMISTFLGRGKRMKRKLKRDERFKSDSQTNS